MSSNITSTKKNFDEMNQSIKAIEEIIQSIQETFDKFSKKMDETIE